MVKKVILIDCNLNFRLDPSIEGKVIFKSDKIQEYLIPFRGDSFLISEFNYLLSDRVIW